MVGISALWLPIVVSAVVVFLASWLVHMLFTYHRSDYQQLPNEDRLTGALRAENLAPGEYMFPYSSSPKEMGSPAMLEKFKRGPVGMLTVVPSAPPMMGKHLAQWFVFCLFVSLFGAYVAGRTLGAGVGYLPVFRIVGTIGFLGYAGSQASQSIWRGQSWELTIKNYIDGLLYGLLTAGTFGWLWPK